MNSVLLGHNKFVECTSILTFKGVPVLKVNWNPLRLELATNGMTPSKEVRVDETATKPEDHVQIVETEDSFAIFWDQQALAVATRLDPQTAHLKLDLRPLGISIYDDSDGLHIGKNVFSGNEVVRSAAAINLG